MERGHDGIGVDFSRKLLEVGRVETSPAAVGWIEADATRLPLRDRSVDAAMCIAVLHHLPTVEDRIAALAEIARVLRGGGRVLVSVWDRDHPRFLGVPLDAQGDAEIPWTLPDGAKIGRYYHLFRDDEFLETIIASGLHGERFFCIAGNRFALATKHG
jgi:ubiquinone/menaquinone biosynthesis C-methylase UbiE